MLDQLLDGNNDSDKKIENILSMDSINDIKNTQDIPQINETIPSMDEIKQSDIPKEETQSNEGENTNPNKGVLYLLNGLGIANKGSFDIDYADIMPNMTMLMSNYLYTSLENVNYNYKSGFRTFSMGNDLLPTYDALEKDMSLSTNPTIVNLINDVIYNQTKLHLFCFLDNIQVVKQVQKLINIFVNKSKFTIFIHIVLRQKDSLLYEEIIDNIKLIDESITLYPNVRIGVITGERNINGDQYANLIFKENGEKWPDYSRKLRFEAEQGITPLKCNPFYMHQGFNIKRNDIALFLNYEDVDCDEFISKIGNVKLYSLFPMKSYSYAINIYDELEPPTYFSKTLEENNLKCLFLTSEDRIPSINYSLCGLNEYESPNIVFGNVSDKKDIKELLKDYDLVVYDYDINRFKEIRRLKEFLMYVDDEINDIYNYCEETGYKMFISSVYGIYKTFIAGIDKEVLVDYSTEVPAVIIDKDIQRAKFMFKYGNTNRLCRTMFNLLTNNPNVETYIRKRGIMSYFKD